MSPEQKGWYTDPWGLHDARWISQGVPSKLVRDGDLESYDEPPGSPPAHAWVPIEPPPGTVTAADTLRADAAAAEATPSLAELNRRAGSTAFTTAAHPWFIARSWTRSSAANPTPGLPATPYSPARRVALIGGGVVAGLMLLVPTYLWVVESSAMASPPSTVWAAVLQGSFFALVAPAVIYLVWRGDRRARVPLVRRLQRAEVISGLLGILSFVLWIGFHTP